MATTSDHNVTETAFDAVKCKLSAATLGYFQDDFLSCFVAKPTRRIPLIHRGYYLRHIAIDDCVKRFLSSNPDTPLQIVSLGAGFDTLFFRLMAQRVAQPIRFVEVDCAAIASAKAEILGRDDTSRTLFAGLRVRRLDANADASYELPDERSTLSLVSRDLGDTPRLEAAWTACGLDPASPTLVIAECVVSYLEPSRGTSLLQSLARWFHDAAIAMYDPIALDDAFGATEQQYFAVKGCELRGLQQYPSARDQMRRLVSEAKWSSCRVVDMNAVFDACTSAAEKQRLQTLECFDEYADWALCNAHYALSIATIGPSADRWSQEFCRGRGLFARTFSSNSETLVLRSFEPQDLRATQKLFQATHLEYSCKAVKKFVFNRVRSGDMADVNASFLAQPRSHFWVITTTSGDVVACIGIKPFVGAGETAATTQTAELCRLSVDAAWRRRGLASVLVEHLESFAQRAAYDAIRLDTIASMASAQAFYAACGYVEAAARESFPGFALVRFSKSLQAKRQ
ncbi:hypothetical protein ATCC90586_006282 [Pythium insidiosum]|nr:hypothetical protein ATCC90586_006282 [Pythium insidiosum]